MGGINIAIVHGYFLGDSGSAVYVRELARELCREGHDVTLISQEADAESYNFIDSFYELDENNQEIIDRFRREQKYSGRCRLVRPCLSGKLLTYVAGPFPGYEAVTFQQAPDAWIDDYNQRNIKALKQVFTRWQPDLVQANHIIMQPFIVHRALAGGAPYVVTVHGSALNFSVKKDSRLVPFAIEGLQHASAIGTLSETSREEIIGFTHEHGLAVANRTMLLPPGVDADLMRPLDREHQLQVLEELPGDIDPASDDVAVFAGRLLWTKGVHYVVAALPLIWQSHPRLHLLVVGDGTMEQPLRALIGMLDCGDLAGARELTRTNTELRASDDYGPIIPDFNIEEERSYIGSARGKFAGQVHFTGHLAHERLAPIYGTADISVAVSVFPEAFALVSIEALACGALPVVTYQSGLRTAADTVVEALADPELRKLGPGVELTRALARVIPSVLERYPTRDAVFRQQLHGIADTLFSWKAVASRLIELALDSNGQ